MYIAPYDKSNDKFSISKLTGSPTFPALPGTSIIVSQAEVTTRKWRISTPDIS